MGSMKSHLATRLLKLRVDEVEVKFRVATVGEDGKPLTQSVRLVASSMECEWLKPNSFLEADPITGVTKEFCCWKKWKLRCAS
jgi:acetyl-CoA carboxylase/biotin carboxylase 1